MLRSLAKLWENFCYSAVGQNFMPKKKLEVQNLYTSFLLWIDNNYQSSSSLYKDFTAQSLVERNFTQENYSGKSVQLPTIWAPTKLLNPEARMLKDFSKEQKTHTQKK